MIVVPQSLADIEAHITQDADAYSVLTSHLDNLCSGSGRKHLLEHAETILEWRREQGL